MGLCYGSFGAEQQGRVFEKVIEGIKKPRGASFCPEDDACVQEPVRADASNIVLILEHARLDSLMAYFSGALVMAGVMLCTSRVRRCRQERYGLVLVHALGLLNQVCTRKRLLCR
jgi:hypothetical protein